MSALREKYVNPLTDFGFKKLFGSEPNKALLIDFLNQILPEHHQIQDLTYSNTEQPGADDLDRKAIFDLYCLGETGSALLLKFKKRSKFFLKTAAFITPLSLFKNKRKKEIGIIAWIQYIQ